MAVPAYDPGDDGALVLAVQQGDVNAFDALFRRHYPAVRRACALRLVDPHEADEVAQAAFVRAFERIGQCGGDRRFGPWIHVIARSLCMDAFRAKARVEPREEPLAGGREHRPNEPEESVLRSERAAHVHEALAALPERQRSAVIARDWEELRPPEIADRLGLSVGAVDSLLLRARRRLALSYRRLAGEGGGGATSHSLRSAVAALGAGLAIGPHALVTAGAAAASTLEGTATRAAGGVVSAVVSVALSVGGAVSPAPSVPTPDPAPAVVSTVTTTVAPPTQLRQSPAAPSPDPSPSLLPAVTPPAPDATQAPTSDRRRAAVELPTSTSTSSTSTTTTTWPAATAAAPPPVQPAASLPPVTVTVALPPLPPVTTPTIPSLPLGLGPR